jgi:hypothetical protein
VRAGAGAGRIANQHAVAGCVMCGDAKTFLACPLETLIKLLSCFNPKPLDKIKRYGYNKIKAIAESIARNP